MYPWAIFFAEREEVKLKDEKDSESSAVGPDYEEILTLISSLNAISQPVHTDFIHNWGFHFCFASSAVGHPSLTSLPCVQHLCLAQVLTTEGCCGLLRRDSSTLGWSRSEPGHCVVEIQLPLRCLFWKSGFLALCEGQCRGELSNERTTREIYS